MNEARKSFKWTPALDNENEVNGLKYLHALTSEMHNSHSEVNASIMHVTFRDAMSISWCPYNWSYTHTMLSILIDSIANEMVKKSKSATTTKQKTKKKVLIRPWNWTLDLRHCSLMRYLSATEITKRINCSQSI